MQIFRRLRDEHGYPGGYDQVRRYVGKHRREPPRDLHPAGPRPRRPARGRLRPHPRRLPRRPPARARPGHRLGLLQRPASSWPCRPSAPRPSSKAWSRPSSSSAACRARSGGTTPRPSPTSILKGASGGPTAATRRWPATTPSSRCSACRPRGNEKPDAESRVRALQRQWATPVPAAAHLAALNAHLRRRCVGRSGTARSSGYEEPIGERFARDRAARPAAAGGAVRRLRDPGRAAWTSTRRCASTATATACRGALRLPGGDGQGLRRPRRGRRRRPGGGRHTRSYGRDEQVLDPLHYLASAGAQAGALDHAPCPARLAAAASRSPRAAAGAGGSGTARAPGVRQYIRVLQLLAEHPARPRRSGPSRTGPRPPASPTPSGSASPRASSDSPAGPAPVTAR